MWRSRSSSVDSWNNLLDEIDSRYSCDDNNDLNLDLSNIRVDMWLTEIPTSPSIPYVDINNVPIEDKIDDDSPLNLTKVIKPMEIEYIVIRDDEDNNKNGNNLNKSNRCQNSLNTIASSSLLTGLPDIYFTHFSFVGSLMNNIPDVKSHPLALKFKHDFMNKRKELVVDLLQIFGNEIFDRHMIDNVTVTWSDRLLSTAGLTMHRMDDDLFPRKTKIKLSSKILTDCQRLTCTLLHELAHAAVWLIDGRRDGHGLYWKRWISKINAKYPTLPNISRCHTYQINFKYKYVCETCGRCRYYHRTRDFSNTTPCRLCKGCIFSIFKKITDNQTFKISYRMKAKPKYVYQCKSCENYVQRCRKSLNLRKHICKCGSDFKLYFRSQNGDLKQEK